MKARRAHRSAKAWKEVFVEQERSGESTADFCEARGIGLSGYREARRRLRRKGGFVELAPVSSWESEVEFPNGMVIRIRRA